MKKKRSISRRITFAVITFFLALLIFWGAGELVFRALVAVKAAGYPTDATVEHPTMGWTAKPNFTFDGTVEDAAGSPYDIHFSTDENSFRFFGDPNSKQPKLLVIGDSYTHAIEVSNDKTYYGLLQDSLGEVELFAFGARGLGPLQQYLWLEEWYDRIKPDLILWQFCFNDVFNSSYELESSSYFNNNHRIRPYLEDDKTVYRNPAPLGLGGLRESSMFLDFLLTKTEVVLQKNQHKDGSAAEDQIKKQGKNYEPYQNALLAVDLSVKKIKEKTGADTAILALQTDVTEPFASDIRKIFESNNIPVVVAAAEKIDLAHKNGTAVWAKDRAHWNETGHAIAAEELWPALKKMVFPLDTAGAAVLNED